MARMLPLWGLMALALLALVACVALQAQQAQAGCIPDTRPDMDADDGSEHDMSGPVPRRRGRGRGRSGGPGREPCLIFCNNLGICSRCPDD